MCGRGVFIALRMVKLSGFLEISPPKQNNILPAQLQLVLGKNSELEIKHL
jgi:hypothetical protein